MANSWETARCFGEKCCVHQQGWKESHARNQQKQVASWAGILLYLLFNPEDGGDMFLQNIGLSLDFNALQRRRLYFPINCYMLTIFYKYMLTILSVLLHGCKIWSLTFKQEYTLPAYEHILLKKIFAPNWSNYICIYTLLYITISTEVMYRD
jgi:hypothetical protein